MLITPNKKIKTDKTKDRWTLVSDEKGNEKVDIDIFKFLRGEEEYVEGKEMIKRVKGLSQRYAEVLLDNQDKIPKEWQSYCIIFSGTIWRTGGGLFVLFLRWYDDCWYLDFGRLDSGFDRCDRVASRKVTSVNDSLETRILELEEFKNKVSKILILE